MESAQMRLPRRIDPDEDKRSQTLTWLYAIRKLPKKREFWIPKENFGTRRWEPSKMLFMEVVRLMDYDDYEISKAAHAVMFRLSEIVPDLENRLGEIPRLCMRKETNSRRQKRTQKTNVTVPRSGVLE
jgi:hypothetical protein